MISLYVHIPFCVSKCNYCDFLSFSANEAIQTEYVLALEKEIELYGRSANYRLASIYFGGGTPSLLTEANFTRLFEAISRSFAIAEDAEITLEANPGTFSLEKAKRFAALGVNRISVGVQSMHDEDLLAMGRIHSVADVSKIVESITHAGIENYSFDLMAGLPEQTEAKMLTTIEKAASLLPNHISLYGLKIEHDTLWGQSLEQGILEVPNEDQAADIMKEAQKLLSLKGFKRYEISNYCQPGFYSRHNLRYWLNEEYLGVGLGASSFLNQKRFTNERNYPKYLAFLGKGVFPVLEREIIDNEMFMAETVILGLRLMEGLERRAFQKRFNLELAYIYSEQIKKHTDLGLVKLTPTHLHLTPRGFEIANEVMLDFLP